jgi:hypothetical protein
MNSGGGGGGGDNDEVVRAIYTIHEEQGMDTINLTPNLAGSSKSAIPPRSILLALVVTLEVPGYILRICSLAQHSSFPNPSGSRPRNLLCL